ARQRSPDLRGDVLQRGLAALLHVEHADGVIAERRAHRIGDLALLQREGGLLEGRHQPPGPTKPRSPPCTALALSSATSRASLPKSSPARARLITSATLAFAALSASLPPTGGTRTSTWATRRRRGSSNSEPCSL